MTAENAEDVVDPSMPEIKHTVYTLCVCSDTLAENIYFRAVKGDYIHRVEESLDATYVAARPYTDEQAFEDFLVCEGD